MAGEAFSSEFRLGNNKRLLKGLFFETTLADKTGVLYSLKDQDHLGYPSLFRLYLECNDPTEWSFANTYLESYDHWEMLCACTWFQPYLERWRKALEMKMKSEALASIIREAKDTKSPSRYTANKYLLERGWEPKEGQGTKRGRPSKDEIKKQALELVEADERAKQDYERLFN